MGPMSNWRQSSWTMEKVLTRKEVINKFPGAGKRVLLSKCLNCGPKSTVVPRGAEDRCWINHRFQTLRGKFWFWKPMNGVRSVILRGSFLSPSLSSRNI
jgi:hypothetical protein